MVLHHAELFLARLSTNWLQTVLIEVQQLICNVNKKRNAEATDKVKELDISERRKIIKNNVNLKNIIYFLKNIVIL